MVDYVEQYSVNGRTYGIEKHSATAYTAWVSGCVIGNRNMTLHEAREALLTHARHDLQGTIYEYDARVAAAQEILTQLNNDQHPLSRKIKQSTSRPNDDEGAAMIYDALNEVNADFTLTLNSDLYHSIYVYDFYLWDSKIHIEYSEKSVLSSSSSESISNEHVYIIGKKAAQEFSKLVLSGIKGAA